MLKCKDVAERASHYIDPNLPWHKKLGWYMHLMMCHNCRRFVKQFRLTIRTVKAAITPQKATASEVKAIMEKIKSSE